LCWTARPSSSGFGISDFNTLHSRKHDDELQYCAFDILAEGGDDLRKLPLSSKANLERLLARRPEGVFINPFEGYRALCNNLLFGGPE
jgi:ATP-dependent DNA ligase